MFNKPERAERIIKITIDIFKTKKVESVNTYINFLSFLPENDELTEILTIAIKRIFETDLETIYWLLEHSHLLSPEGDIKAIVSNILKDKILFLGFDEQDFDFAQQGYLRVNNEIKENLLNSYFFESSLFSLILNFLAQEAVPT